jgi:2-keto-4-pentenoate hydratase
VDQPDFGHLLDTMFLPEGAPADAGRFLQPKAEPEIAFVIGRPLSGPGVTVADAIAAVDFVLAALEIIDSRIADWKITLADTIADNASSGGAVLGSPVNALVWLANVLGERGVTLEAGHVVLPGSVCAAVPFGPGDTVSATFDRIGSVTVTFSERPGLRRRRYHGHRPDPGRHGTVRLSSGERGWRGSRSSLRSATTATTCRSGQATSTL